MRITYVGHATVQIEAGSSRLLTDPVLGPRVAYLRRIVPPPRLAELDRPDALLISHAHFDHLDAASLKLLHPCPAIVFDGALAGYGLLQAPLRLHLRDGRAVSAEGEAADWLLSTLDAGGEHGRSIAEVGIGTNPSAEVCGEIAVDEKVLGTAHIAFGTSLACGGANEAGVHIDGILLEPTVELDGVPVTARRPTRGSGR
jgi:Beta-lactamase superfamily domain